MTIKENDNSYLIYLKKNEIDKIDFSSLNNLEEYFIKLFTKIKNRYESFNYGFYKLNIYLDKYYGGVIETININSPNTYLIDQVDMTLNIIDDNFLYLIDNYKFDRKNFDYYLYNSQIYAKLKGEIDYSLMYILLENSKLIFNTEKIIASSKKI